MPFNSTYFVGSAFRANLFCNAVCNYKKAFDLCKEAKHQLKSLSDLHVYFFVEHLPFPLKHEWCGLYDKNIQILLGFLTLYKATTTRKLTLPVHICSLQYLSYIYTRCGRILNEPCFGFDYRYMRPNRFNIVSYHDKFTYAILRTALCIG